ncbi:MAG: DUF6788 family protein [Nitrospiria bacterium]
MGKQNISIKADGPILSGNVFVSWVKCGKKNCRCAINPDKRHKVYQWSGNIDGKNSSRALTREMFLECKKRIANYKKFKRLFNLEVKKAFKVAPWVKFRR